MPKNPDHEGFPTPEELTELFDETYKWLRVKGERQDLKGFQRMHFDLPVCKEPARFTVVPDVQKLSSFAPEHIKDLGICGKLIIAASLPHYTYEPDEPYRPVYEERDFMPEEVRLSFAPADESAYSKIYYTLSPGYPEGLYEQEAKRCHAKPTGQPVDGRDLLAKYELEALLRPERITNSDYAAIEGILGTLATNWHDLSPAKHGDNQS